AKLLRREKGRRPSAEVEGSSDRIRGPDFSARLLDKSLVKRPVRLDEDERAVRAALAAERDVDVDADGIHYFSSPYTTLPLKIVATTLAFKISRGVALRRLVSRTTRSAHFPGSIEPFSFSANSAYAEPSV